MVSFLGTVTSPSSGASIADNHPEQGGLAGAVWPDQADFLARIELERGFDENQLLAVLFLNIGERDHPVRW